MGMLLRRHYETARLEQQRLQQEAEVAAALAFSQQPQPETDPGEIEFDPETVGDAIAAGFAGLKSPEPESPPAAPGPASEPQKKRK